MNSGRTLSVQMIGLGVPPNVEGWWRSRCPQCNGTPRTGPVRWQSRSRRVCMLPVPTPPPPHRGIGGCAGAGRYWNILAPMTYFAHPTAVIEADALIGSDTYVWHHSHVRSGATVGASCVLGKNVYVDEGARIGDRCKIQNNVSVYNGVVIGDDVFVGPAATFTNDRVPRAFNHDWVITPTTVANGASIGANATIVCGSTLGEFCMVAAGSTVTRSVHAYQLAGGSPARHMGWVCRCGTVLTRSEERPSEERCQLCQASSFPTPSTEPTGS